ncbi:hypothetical protein DSOUD_2684 [Desulfuromonas soudanensis]|uniref:Type II secretion system protein GspE N-terminal domain-containing protein n=1 Tax=Desulfuromonas soudanensis TaxID=1603606 RepID=A0A0M4D2X9_9BACT|nr:hypothetical protein [Desulfuromonas soudanensis]ALC17434.1 hypothetical protein DSOUD_2684 [Desulfuromonas soudanensis]
MAVKLGELLISQGKITAGQLEEALKYQVIFGGKLGTNLLEMGFLEEEDIARILSKKLGVPFMESAAHFASIPEEVIALIPRELAVKHQVVPVKLENRKLSLAMLDPSDLKAIDELSFRTGFIIRPMVTPEVRLLGALEKYYQVQRTARYIQIIRDRIPSPPSAPSRPVPQARPVAKAPTPRRPLPTPAAPQTTPPPQIWPDADVVDGLEEVDILDEVLPLPEDEPCTLDSISSRLSESSDREDIADGIAEYIGQEFPRGALFMIRGGNAFGWKAMMDGEEIARFDEFQIPLDEPSVLKTVAETGSNFLGPIPRTPFNSMMLQEFGGRMPETALLLPLFMMGRVVGILYIDGDSSGIRARIGDLQRLVAKAIMAFEILILKKKILTL